MTRNVFKTRPARITPALFAGTLAIMISQGAVAAEGFGPASLSGLIDDQIEAFLQDEGVAGATVAVTQKNRLIYSKGFGRSSRSEDGNADVLMQPTFRTRIGSVSKAIVSGPATYQAMKERGFDPATKKVYGSNSIFGERYSLQQRVSIDRFEPIIALAIAPNGQSYAWYRNGTVSFGQTSDLTKHEEPRSFTVAEGKVIADLHAVAISKAGDVYAWYRDGSRSVGTSHDLDARVPLLLNEDGKPRKARLPVGPDGDRKSMSDVVGIAIAKSDGDVYAWYDDLTVSAGSSMDFGEIFSDETYSAPAENGRSWRYRIRGMGISPNDTVYTWSSTGKAIAGNSRDLAAKRAPYEYKFAFDEHYRNRYRDITVQHLFDHKSGFTRSGDVAATARMFPNQLGDGTEPSYDQIHKHFLATRPLLSDPGVQYSYSNHGMGLMTLLIEELSGETYREYAINHYLAPMGLKGKVQAQKANPGPDQSLAYDYNSNTGVHTVRPFKNSTVGLAAGGWTSSATAIVAVTRELMERYSYNELNDFGFGSQGTGDRLKLSHTGATGGGYSRVDLFSENYVAQNGNDLGDVHIAIAFNTRVRGDAEDGFGGRLRSLVNIIAHATAEAAIPETVDHWPQAWD